MANIRKYLVETNPSLFLSEGDTKDMKMGKIVNRFSPKTDDKVLQDMSIAIVGVPDDTGIIKNKGRPGASKGPKAVRRAFYRLTPGWKDSIGELKIIDMGDVKIDTNIEETHNNVKKVISETVRLGITPICIGGGHDITHPNIAGFIEGYEKALSLNESNHKFGLINVDSHFDVRNLKFGITSGTSFFRTLELPHRPVLGKNFVEVGIQGHHNSPLHYQYLVEMGGKIIFLDEVQSKGIDEVMKDAFESAGSGTESIYVSFDVDAVRMADAPGVSASYPNGLSSKEMEMATYLVGRNPKVGMIDIMEISPALDQDDKTAKLGASMIFHFLKGFAERKKL